MPPQISEADLKAAIEARARHKTSREAAEELGIPESTYKHRLYRAQRKGVSLIETKEEEQDDVGLRGNVDLQNGTGWLELVDYAMPSAEQVLEKYNLDPACWRITRVAPNQWQGFYKKGKGADASAERVTLHQLKIWIERIVPVPVEEAAKILAERIKPLPAPRGKPKVSSTVDLLAVFGIYDAHIGSLCWGEEVGGDYDLQIAGKRVRNAIDDLAASLARNPISKILIPVGNDFMHFDNFRGETTSGRVIVDQDTRYPRVVVACHDLLAYQVDRALEICDDVEILWIGGNHDYVASLHFCHWLAQRYKNDPRVTVDTSPRKRKYRAWGKTLLGFTHGDKINPKDTYRIMAEEASEHWGSATCREWHTGDKHHRKQIDQTSTDSMGKVTFRINPSLAQADFWHYEQGYNAVRCADVWLYSGVGFLGMHTTYARDD